MNLYTAEDDDGNIAQAVVYQLPETGHAHVIVWQDELLTEDDKDKIISELDDGIIEGRSGLGCHSRLGPRCQAEGKDSHDDGAHNKDQ